MIFLYTGQNGHGKTLLAMKRALALKSEGREVYVCNVKGVDYEKTGFLDLDAFANWQDCPDGAVIVVDECWEFIPARAVGKQGPKWEQDLAVHRHRGFDFILICQGGNQISTHVRNLVHEHTHVRRKFGAQLAVLLTWDRYQPNVSSATELKQARMQTFPYPKEVFGLYKSATVHTAKVSIPWRLISIPVLLLVIIGLGATFFYRFSHKAEVANAVVGEPTPAQAGGGVPAKQEEKKPETAEEWAAQFVPRIPGMPWSAPWHDETKPRVDPDIYCVSGEAIGCRCYTEQITQLNVPLLQCYQIARHGIYNPFRAAVRQSLDPSHPEMRDQNPQRGRDLADSSAVQEFEVRPVPSAVPASLARQPMNAGSAWPSR